MSIVPPQSLHYRVLAPASPASAERKAPLVLLHGLMGFAANWGKIWPYFQEERQVLVLDQRGHGRSAKPKSGYTPTDYAEDLHALLAHLGWEKCHIVGHSMGGRVAVRFTSLHPDQALSLTLEDSGIEANPKRIEWIRDLLGSIPTPFPNREAAKQFFQTHFANDPMTGSFLHANLEASESGSMDWRFYAPGMTETIEQGRATDAMAEFRSLQLPTLIIRGGRSREFPREEAERMQQIRPGVELVEIPEAGHFVHAEQPGPFSQALASFLAASGH